MSAWADTWLFVLLFLLGSGTMIVLKWRAVPQWSVTAVPIATMLVYTLYVGLTPRYRLRADRAGDSLYYLGFLFTMVSLAYSLYEFGRKGGTESIVTNFGIALATTILGLMFRVLFQQLREDPFDVEREVYLDLSEAASELRDQVSQCVQDFNALRVVIAQSVQEAAAGATGKLVDVLAESLGRYTKSVGQLTTTVEDATGQLKSHQAAMTAAARKSATSVERLATRMDEVEIPSSAIRSKLEGMTTRLDAFVEGLSKRSLIEGQHGEKLNAVLQIGVEAAESLRRQLESLTAATAAHQQLVHKASGDAEKAIKDFSTLASVALKQSADAGEAHQAVVDELLQSTNAALRAAREHRDKLASDVAESSAMLSQVHSSLVSLTRVLVTELDGKPRRV